METYLIKIKEVINYLCNNCQHEQCNTTNCAIDKLTEDDIINIYNKI